MVLVWGWILLRIFWGEGMEILLFEFVFWILVSFGGGGVGYFVILFLYFLYK